MKSNKNCLRQKCGDIFLKINTIKNKAKVFTFHCTLCSIDCDQIKKFSKHLESHLVFFENQLRNEIVRDNNDINNINVCLESEDIKVETEYDELVKDNDDPLETAKIIKTEMDSSTNIKSEEYIEEDIENYAKSCIEMLSNDVGNIEKAEEIIGEAKKIKITKNCSLYNELNPLESSTDSDFDKSTCTKMSTECNKPKRRRRVLIESILPFLIQQYKKYKILWQIEDIAFGIKIKKYEIFAQIAESLKLEQQKEMSLDDLNYHINYLNELYSKDKEQELKCKMDKVEFVPEFEHYKEMSFLSKSQGPFLCTICNEIQPRYHSYCQHLAAHNNTLPYKCPLCDSTFVNYHKYLVHKKRHLGIVDFHCKICDKGYMFKNDLEWHVTSHTGVKPYLCQICGASFRARHHYNSHVRKHEQRFRHECHICKKGFNYLDNLNSHVKSHLNIRDVVCQICGKGFVHTKYLRRHEMIHSEEKRYKCNDCGKDFFQPSGLRVHRKNHHS